MRWARLAAALALAAICYALGVRVGAGRMQPAAAAPRPAYETYGPAELANAAEGLTERIAAMTAELERVQALQRDQLDN